MSTELVTTGMSVPDKMQYAEALATANLLPKQYQRNPGNVLLAIELGESLGIPPIQAINTVHVIEGKPSASAALISALVRRAGHTLRVKGDDKSAVAQIVRKDDPDFTYEVEWNLERAKTAGLLSGKNNWSKYPAAMLKARAVTECARDACQEALMGVSYTPEELGAVVDEEGNPVEMKRPAPPRTRTVKEPSQPANEIPVEPSGRDWMGELQDCETREDVVQLWKAAQAHGELTDELKQELTLAGKALPAAVDVVTGEIITEGEAA